MAYTLAWKNRYYSLAENMPASTPESPHNGDFSFRVLNNGLNSLILNASKEEIAWIFDSATQGAMLLYPEQAQTIMEILLRMIDYPPEFETELNDCPQFPPSASFVEYLPSNPYNQPDYVPSGYLNPPFLVNTDFAYPEFFGYQATDVMVTPDSLPFLGGWGDLLGLNFPTVKITVRGQGQIELDLLSVVIGGYAIIKVGSPPNIIDIVDGIIETGVTIVDLNQDALGLPIESDIVIAEEINIDSVDWIDVYITFVPKIDDSITFFGFGGGIRQIGLCGLETAIGVGIVEDVRFNPENCTFEKRVAGVWVSIDNGDDWLICVEELMATQAEIKQAIIDAAEQLAAQMLAGETENMKADFTYSKDTGEKTFAPIGVADDPVTPDIDESLASLQGGASYVLSEVEGVMDKLDTYYGGSNGSPSNSEAFTEVAMSLLYPFDPILLEVAIANYYLYRASNGYIAYNSSLTHENYMYCNGGGKQAWTMLMAELTGWNEAKLSMVKSVTDALLQSFWDNAFELGAAIPSTKYLDAACTPMKTQLLEDVPYSSLRALVPATAKGGHRLKITVSGYYVDPDGDIQDAFWYRTNAGVTTRSNFTFTHGGGQNMPSDSQVPYRGDHTYTYTIDLATGNSSWSLQFNRNGGMNVASTSPTDGFTISIEDLGVY